MTPRGMIRRALLEAIPYGRWASAEELARAIGFTANDVAREAILLQRSLRIDRRVLSVGYHGGGNLYSYRRLRPGESQALVDDLAWEMRPLDDALGGITFPPPGFRVPKAGRVHHLRG